MTPTKTIKASELQTGMYLRRGVYDRFTEVTRVRVGITHTTYDLADGSSCDVRNQTVCEVRS